MNFEQLKIFLTVVELRSFTRAAESMYISHSTTSRNVSALEESLGVRLLQRDNRSVRLTPAGEVLVREADKLLKRVEEVESAVRSAGLGRAGKLSVAGAELHTHPVWERLQAFCRMYPDVDMAVYAAPVRSAWEQVRTGEVDMALVFSYCLPDEIPEFRVETVSREHFCAVLPAGHPLAERQHLQMGALLGHPLWTVPTEDADAARFLTGRNALLRSFREVRTAPTMESLLLRLGGGSGLALLPAPLAREHCRDFAVRPVEDLDSEFDLQLVWRRDCLKPSLPRLAEMLLNRPLQTEEAQEEERT